MFPTRLAPHRHALQEFITTRQGYRLATSTGGVLTGRGGDARPRLGSRHAHKRGWASKEAFTHFLGQAMIGAALTHQNKGDRSMPISMYHASVPVFLQLLGGLKGFIEKGEVEATAKKWDPNVVLNLRLYPDMFTLARQARQASEHAFGAGRAAGVEVPNLPAIDNSFEEMKARIDKTVDFLKTLRPEQLDGKEDAQVTITAGGQPRTFRAQIYLYHFAMPNFYFHITTAYNILRSLGVGIGKRDFMGEMPS